MERETGLSAPSDSEKPYVSDREEGSEGQSYSGHDKETGPGPDKPADTGSPTAPGPEKSAPQTLQHGPIPDGGVEAWLQVLGSWVTLVATWGLVNTFGVYQTYYETTLLTSSSSSAISWIGSLQASLLMLIGVVAGPLYDAGYFRHLLISGLFLIVLGQFMTSLGTEYWQILLAQGVCVGIGMGFIMLPSTAILAQYFTTKRAFAIGISSSGSPLAGIVFPIIFSRLGPIIGFGWATRVIAFILLGLSVIPIAFMKTRVPPSGRKRALIDASALRDSVFILFVAASVLIFLCMYTAFFYIQLFSETHHLSSPDFSPYLVTLLNVGSVFGRILPGYFADKLGSVNMAIVCAAVSSILAYGWLGIHNLAGIVVFALLYGLFSGGIVSLLPSAVIALTPDMSRVGTRMGMMYTLTGFSILVGTPIAGAILGGYSDREWQGVIGYSAAGLTLGSILYLAARAVLYRRNGKLAA
jgi:MFS family permease